MLLQHHIHGRTQGTTHLTVQCSKVKGSRVRQLVPTARNPWIRRTCNPGILAQPIQSPSYHLLKTHFHLIYLEDAATRVCFYINKRIDPGTWSVSCILKDIICLSIGNPHSGKNINIFHVYNEVATITLTILAEALANLEPLTNTVLLGDFNLHHPLWSTTHRRPGHGPCVHQLISTIQDFQPEVLTEPGTPTHKWSDGESTIDLTFASLPRTLYGM